ncbi:MAG: class I SAM-dependent methyltransferase [Patescibacteria group bacterium]
MANYNIFSKFYDSVMGDRSIEVSMVKKIISERCPKAKVILEIACGTGSILKLLPKKFEIYGLDISKKMLAVAKKKIPRAKLSHQDMRDFKFSEKFDIILCLFDSINHLIKLSDWKKVFVNVQKHLNNNGVFIFDINTEAKLKRLSVESSFTQKFGKNYMVMNITDKDKGIMNWNVKIFESRKNNDRMIFEENIEEKSYPVKDIKVILQSIYSEVEVFDQKRNKPSQNSERVYFICRK